MKPIDPQVKSILYDGVPSFIAAENYMRERFLHKILILCEYMPKGILLLPYNKLK